MKNKILISIMVAFFTYIFIISGLGLLNNKSENSDLSDEAQGNDMYVVDDYIFKIERTFDEDKIYNMSDYLNKVYHMYLKNNNVFFSIIPEKNYLIQENDKLAMEYKEIEKIMVDNIKNMTYIDIDNWLELNDYYKTDSHWKQENLNKVVKTISDKMNFIHDVNTIKYDLKSYDPFYGVYYSDDILNIDPDELIYKTNSIIENSIVSNYEYSGEEGKQPGIYDMQKLTGSYLYDVFLSGSTPLTSIQNPENKSGKELIIFRDSFASSLTPLLIEEYSKITLIDLRYVSYRIIGDYVDFNTQDVLFIYSTLIINNSNILK